MTRILTMFEELRKVIMTIKTSKQSKNNLSDILRNNESKINNG